MHWAHLTTETTARRRYLENLGELSTIYGDTTVSRWRCSSAQTMFKTANSFDRGLFRFWAKRVLSYPMLLFRSRSKHQPDFSEAYIFCAGQANVSISMAVVVTIGYNELITLLCEKQSLISPFW